MTIAPRRVALAAALAALAICTTAAAGPAGRMLPPPSFRPASGWWLLTTGPSGGRVAPETWVANDRGTDQEALFNLFVGLRKLTTQGIVIWAINEGRGGPTRAFTRATWPLKLSSFRRDESWEGQPATNVQQRLRWADVAGWHLDVRVYFGSQHPDKATVAKAQAELDRLLLP